MLRLRLARLGIAGILFSAQAPIASASTIAIIDSGIDIKHPDLVDNIWTNPVDFSADGRDNDNNGFKDDINGWNFFANNNQLIELKYTSVYSAEIEKFFAIQDKFMLGTITDEEMDWIKSKAADKAFVKNIMIYGTFVHGTHVAGIAPKDNPDAKIATIRLVPVENPLLGSLMDEIQRAVRAGVEPNIIQKGLIKGGLWLLASGQGTAFGMIGDYAKSIKADVANASLGVGMMQAKMIVTPLIKASIDGQEPSEAAVEELAIYFLEQAVKAQSKIATNSPDTLFVFASGNDGTSNDKYPVAPANAGLENTISVGASVETSGIALFSNYGKKVDVLAPGVAIMSSVPGGQQKPLTGTSQAAPYVTGVAAHLKDINPALKPADLKQILIGTVDIREELKDKTLSSGIVNRARALAAAERSKSMSIADAISEARIAVADQPREGTLDPNRARPFTFIQPQLILDKVQ